MAKKRENWETQELVRARQRVYETVIGMLEGRVSRAEPFEALARALAELEAAARG